MVAACSLAGIRNSGRGGAGSDSRQVCASPTSKSKGTLIGCSCLDHNTLDPRSAIDTLVVENAAAGLNLG